ncbi:hypothetical protein [Rhodopseudomonas sp. B29]|uniref:hypothetical protein n=1 Tax=Rhodopseudomonas sp. B29 TaxID=95607 RepID=UPI00034DD5DC|nr:hypothetical protein [Rhodopseudomonas sp. B29]
MTYGEGEKALKLNGRADIRFGAAPRIDAALAAKQLDLDRLLAKDGDQNAAAWLGKLRDFLASLPQPPLPARISLDTDQIMIGGRAVTDVTAVLRGDATSLSIEQADLRAPGGSHLVMSGSNAVSAKPQGGIKASLVVDSSDPALLAAWLQGRAAPATGAAKPLKAQGDISVSESHLAVDRLVLERDGGKLQGHLAFRAATPQQARTSMLPWPGNSADLEIAKGLIRSLLGDDNNRGAGWPDAADLDLDLAAPSGAGRAGSRCRPG